MKPREMSWYKVYAPKSETFQEIYADSAKIKGWFSKHLVLYRRNKIVACFVDWEFFIERKSK